MFNPFGVVAFGSPLNKEITGNTMKQTSLALALILAATCPGNTHAEAPKKVFRAGAFAIDITPTKFPVASSGSMTPRLALRAHDRLHARCLVLDNGKTTIAFAICDSCMIPREIFDAAKAIAAKKTGIRVDRILTSATHTHTAVTVTPTFQSGVETEYCKFLTQRIAEGIIRAHGQLEPARIGWAVGNNTAQVFNRRWYMRPDVALADPFDRGTDRVRVNPARGSAKLAQPSGPTDPEVPIIAVQAIDGRPIALMANYSLHYVGGVPAASLSADYFGEFARVMGLNLQRKDAPVKFVGMMTNGTSGNINNINFFESSTRQLPFEQIRLVGADVARSAMSAYGRIELHDWVPLAMVEREISLGVRQPSQDEILRAKKILAAAGKAPYHDRRAIYAVETIHLAEYPKTVQVKLQAIRIGELGIVSSPCETFVETGLAIKDKSPLKPTFTIELANGYNGYLPTVKHHALGGYETWRAKSSYLAIDAEPKVRSTLLELLESVAK